MNESEKKPETVDKLADDTCPTGYYWDEETQKCILDVGPPPNKVEESE
jgi:hypothetical protein